MRSPWTDVAERASIHRSIAMLAAASRRVVRRAAANKYNIPQALLERAPSNASSKDKHGNDWDGWRWEGYASGWIYDGRKGFPEHQPGFLTSRARCLCTAAANVNVRELPVMRLPTTVFPLHPVTLPIIEASPHARPWPGAPTPAQADEVSESLGGKIALLADGATVGVIVDLPQTSTAAANGMMLHVVGGERITLLETTQRTRTGMRLARFAPLDDDEPASRTAMEDEAIVARALLEDRERLPIQTDDWELLLCTLEDELSWLPSEADPTSHPKLIESAVMPQGATELSFWLACRLPLTTALRIHLLSCTCPTKRLRDLVDAMRLLADPAGEYVKVRGKRIRGKLRVVWETAEASGCELAPPRPVVDWAHGGDIGVSRY